MYSVLLRDGFSVSRTHARLRIESALDLHRLFRLIDSDPATVGAGVVYIDSDLNIVTLRDFQPVCSIVVKNLILREPPRHKAAQEFARELQEDSHESRFIIELLSAGLACTGAILSWSAIVGSGMAIPFSGGASAAITVIAYSAAIAGSVQCIGGIGRVVTALNDLQALHDLDAQKWYQNTAMILDGISLMGAGAATLVTARYVLAAKAATGKSVVAVLHGLSRQERARLTAELLKLRKPDPVFPKRYANTVIRQQAIVQIKEMLSAAAAVTGSSISGNINFIAIGIYEEFKDH